MKKKFNLLLLIIFPLSGGLVLSSFNITQSASLNFSFPYKKAGLTDREAAAHIVSRFSFGVKPGQIDAVSKHGVEEWFKDQLAAAFAESLSITPSFIAFLNNCPPLG